MVYSAIDYFSYSLLIKEFSFWNSIKLYYNYGRVSPINDCDVFYYGVNLKLKSISIKKKKKNKTRFSPETAV